MLLFDQKSEYSNKYIIDFLFSDKYTKYQILSNYPNKEQISKFITKCTSSAEESLLINLFDWKSDSRWTSENPKGVVRNKYF